MFVTSSLDTATAVKYAVPECYEGCGVLGDVAQAGEPDPCVQVPFSEQAIQAWAEASDTVISSGKEIKVYLDVLEVRHADALNPEVSDPAQIQDNCCLNLHTICRTLWQTHEQSCHTRAQRVFC